MSGDSLSPANYAKTMACQAVTPVKEPKKKETVVARVVKAVAKK